MICLLQTETALLILASVASRLAANFQYKAETARFGNLVQVVSVEVPVVLSSSCSGLTSAFFVMLVYNLWRC